MHRSALILLLSCEAALAHPDHGSGGWLSADLFHLLTEPDHLAVILAPLVIGVIWFLRRKKNRALTPISPRRNRAAAGRAFPPGGAR